MRFPALVCLHLVALAFGTYTAFRVTLDSRFARMQTDPGDTVLNHYLLEHSWRVVSDSSYPHSLWSPPFYHPTPLVLTYSENMLGVAPVFWLLRMMLPTDLAFQVWMMVLSALNYLAMAAVLYRLRIRDGERLPHLLIALGGFLWAYGLPHQVQLSHQQLIGRFWMPLAAYFAWQFARTPSARLLNRVLLFLFLQLVTCVNTGWFLAFGLGVFVPVGVWVNGSWPQLRECVQRQRWWILGIVFGWGLAAVLFLMPYLVGNHDRPRPYWACIEHMPTLASLVAGPPDSRWYETIRNLRGSVGLEAWFFCGFGFYFLLLAAVVAVRVRRSEGEPGVRFAAAGLISAVVLLLLTLNYGSGVSPWWLVRLAPGGLAIRAIGRVQLAIYLVLIPAVLIGFTLWVQTRLKDARARTVVYALAVAVIGFEQTGYEGMSFEKPPVYDTADRIAEQFRGADVGYVTIPEGMDPMYPSLIAMWAGLKANVPIVNGYSGREPPDFPVGQRLTDADVKAWLGPPFRGKTLVIVDVTQSPWAVRRYVLE